jgi:hypothetical protein
MKKYLFLGVALAMLVASLALTGVAFAQDPLPPPPLPGDNGGPGAPPVPPVPLPNYNIVPPQQQPNYNYNVNSWCKWYPQYCVDYKHYWQYQTYYKNYFGKGGIWYAKPWNYNRSGSRWMVWDDDWYYVYGTKVYTPAPYYASTQPQAETYAVTATTQPAYNQWTVSMLGSMAKALGLSLDEFKKEIAAGKSPAEMAAAKGMTADQFRTAWQEDLNLEMAKEVTAGKLDQKLATEIFNYLKTKWNSW